MRNEKKEDRRQEAGVRSQEAEDRSQRVKRLKGKEANRLWILEFGFRIARKEE
jgi:hypothetical protein